MPDTAQIFQFPERRDDAQAPGPERSGRSPQVEDGFTRIANELLEEVMAAPLTLREMRTVLAIIRLTYGWNRKQARVTGGLLAKLTGMPATKVSQTLSSLVEKNVIIRHGGSRSPVSLNKHADQWAVERKERKTPPPKQAKQGENNQTGQGEPKGYDSNQNGKSESYQNGNASKDMKDIPPLPSVEGEPSDEAEQQSAEPKPQPKPKPKPKRQASYPDEFEQLWAKYPKRGGGNPKKPAYKAWCARLKEGVSAETLHDAVDRYAAFVRAKGDERTEFVQQAQRFLGPNGEYENDWQPPKNRADGKPGRLGMVQPKPQGSYTPTDMDNLPDWMRD